MISRERLLWDGRIQLTLGALGLLSWLATWPISLVVCLSLLLLWQLASAWELYVYYEHQARKHYLWLLPLVVIIALLGRIGIRPYFWPLGIMPGLVCIAIFGWHTVRDYLVVRRRPKSFWDI